MQINNMYPWWEHPKKMKIIEEKIKEDKVLHNPGEEKTMTELEKQQIRLGCMNAAIDLLSRSHISPKGLAEIEYLIFKVNDYVVNGSANKPRIISMRYDTTPNENDPDTGILDAMDKVEDKKIVIKKISNDDLETDEQKHLSEEEERHSKEKKKAHLKNDACWKAVELAKSVIEEAKDKLRVVGIDHIQPMSLWEGAFPVIGGVPEGEYTVVTLGVLVPNKTNEIKRGTLTSEEEAECMKKVGMEDYIDNVAKREGI